VFYRASILWGRNAEGVLGQMMGTLSLWHWLLVLAIILLIFWTKKLPNIGRDLGGAVRGFKEGVYKVDSLNRDKT